MCHVIDENLPLGIIAYTAAIMGITLGKQMPEGVGTDVYHSKTVALCVIFQYGFLYADTLGVLAVSLESPHYKAVIMSHSLFRFHFFSAYIMPFHNYFVSVGCRLALCLVLLSLLINLLPYNKIERID